jgi:hypothetical protein
METEILVLLSYGATFLVFLSRSLNSNAPNQATDGGGLGEGVHARTKCEKPPQYQNFSFSNL